MVEGGVKVGLGAAEPRGVEGGSIESWAERAPATRQALGEETDERERMCVCVSCYVQRRRRSETRRRKGRSLGETE